MRQLLKTQVLDALKDSLREVENLTLVSADDPEVTLLRQDLRNKIVEIENDGSKDGELTGGSVKPAYPLWPETAGFIWR